MYDSCKTNDDLRISTGPGRYQLGEPSQACGACYVSDPSIRQQKWGAAMNTQYIKTDVESDLMNINRPPTRNNCGLYDPRTNAMNKAATELPKTCEFSQVHTRLNDPPCNLRSSGWNRFEWLCQNPQENTLLPFDNLVTTRLAAKDSYRPCIPTPIGDLNVLPAPSAYNPTGKYGDLSPTLLETVGTAVSNAFESYPRGVDVIPAAPSNIFGTAQIAPINPPDMQIRTGIGGFINS
jgi:hypothetical protein